MNPYLSIQTKISEKFLAAEEKLQTAGYTVIRHVRGLPVNEVFGLEVFGETLYHLEKVRSVLGQGYRLVLNIQMQSILIR